MLVLVVAVIAFLFFVSGGHLITEPLGQLLTWIGDLLDEWYDSTDKEGKS